MRTKTSLLCITVILQGLVLQSACRVFNSGTTPRMDLMSEETTIASTESSGSTAEETGSSFLTSRDITPSYSVSRAIATREIPARQSVTESSQQLKQAVQDAAKGGVVDVITTATAITNISSSLSKSFVDLMR
ncbi:uncharacterized protein LOC126833499 isoform X2 [Adelges cooleyi]|uniref:uncharacterized protein LOC126833499 isoform X2 n=1 Tax=Adelges cooleyi TaxID=133065 RepID=UPI00217FA851|nr:uncharacterized protein LOC126833499 isoform X2 [Adelges cooleyi]